MLLQALYEYAVTNDLLKDSAFENRPVRWVIPLDADGNMRGEGLIDLVSPDEKKGRTFSCPKTIRPKTGGGVAEFLADTITPVFNIESDPMKLEDSIPPARARREKNNREKHQDFLDQIEQGFLKTESPILKAISNYYKKYKTLGDLQPKYSFLRWGLSPNPKQNEKEKWWVMSATGETALNAGDRFTFEIDGSLALTDPQLRVYWRSDVSALERSETEINAKRGICIITGKREQAITRSHPKIKKVPGAQAESYLISYSAQTAGDVCSFSSFGWKKGQNAPVSTEASEAYAFALNDLLSNNDRHIRLGPIVICFWAKRHQEFSDALRNLFYKPSTESIRLFFQKWRMGIEDNEIKYDRFYSLSLSGNAGRVAVRRWFDQSLEEVSKNIKQWFDDLEIQEIVKKKKEGDSNKELPFSLLNLASATVRDRKDILAEVPIRLSAAALEGNEPPLLWLKPILHRFHCDLVKRNDPKSYPFNPSRFALIKLILIRNCKKGVSFMPTVSLTETNDKAYNLGRLLAVFERLQDTAHEFQLEGAGVIERYYGTASSSPATIFPLLIRLSRHHLRKLERSVEKGKKSAYFIDKEIAAILATIESHVEGAPPSFPRSLSLEEQGRFALGFYQQKAYESQKAEERKIKKESENND